jgi:hypothetical protein
VAARDASGARPASRLPRATATFGAVAALLLSACTGSVSTPAVAGPIPRCNDVPRIAAPADRYRDAPIYVSNEMPTEAVQAWASGKPGFEELWIDRDHLGWITVAFSRDADARQAELAKAFPGVGVVAVGVDWTKAELEALQRKVMTDAAPLVSASGLMTDHGVVEIYVPVLKPDVVAQIRAKFGGLRVCLNGLDPSDAPVEGPQQAAGEGWRLLADQDQVGGPYKTGIAADAQSFTALWASIGLAGTVPEVDFQTEVAVWFGAVHGSSCPRLRLDDVIADTDRALLYPRITAFNAGICTADAIGHAYVVAVERAKLPAGPFTIQLQSDEPPAGAVDEKTIVDADLSVPGSTVDAGQLHSASHAPEEIRVEPGGVIEPGVLWRYRVPVRCGLEWLGKLNGVWWRTAVPDGATAWIPDAWRGDVDANGSIDLRITLDPGPQATIVATAGSLSVTYVASAVVGPTCD